MKRARFLPAALATAVLSSLVFSANPANAESCSASAASIVSRSTGGTCSMALALNQVFTLTFRLRNDSIIDSGPNDGDLVSGTIFSGEHVAARAPGTV